MQSQFCTVFLCCKTLVLFFDDGISINVATADRIRKKQCSFELVGKYIPSAGCGGRGVLRYDVGILRAKINTLGNCVKRIMTQFFVRGSKERIILFTV